MLTVACQFSPDKQNKVAEAINYVSQTNRQYHLLFSQVGEKLSFTPEAVIRGAFLMLWMQENPEEVTRIVEAVKQAFNDLQKK